MLSFSIQAHLKFVVISTARCCFLVFVSFVFSVALSDVFSFIYFTLCGVNRPLYISRTERQRQRRKEMEYVLKKKVGIKKENEMKNEAEVKIKTLRKAIIAPEMKWKCEVSLKEKLDRNFHLIPAT